MFRQEHRRSLVAFGGVLSRGGYSNFPGDDGCKGGCTQTTCVLVSETKPDKVSLCAHLIKTQRLGVRFKGFFVVFLALLYQAENVPTDMGREIESHALLDEIDALFASSHVGEQETLHT